MAWALVLALVCACAAHALEPSTPLANLNRQGWVMENGLPQNTIHALAQTADGFLWLGTEVGLVRFDGVNFATFDEHSKPALPSGDIRCLLAARDGSLWIGTGDGLARMRDGAVTTFTAKDGLPGDEIRSLRFDSSDVLVVSTDQGVVGIRGTGPVAAIFAIPESAAPALQVTFSAVLSDGSHVQGTANTVTVPLQGKNVDLRAGRELPGTRIQVLYADVENALWIGTNGGLVRYAYGKLEKFPLTDPLATASVLSILEDREGNLWVGTEASGLQILRDSRFRTFSAHEGLSSDSVSTVVEDHAGRLWVGTTNSGLNVVTLTGIQPGEPTFAPVHAALTSEVVLSLAAAPNGDLWVGTPDGLNRIHYGAVDTYTSFDGLPDDFIRSLLVDTDGSIWIGTRHGLAHMTFPPGLPAHIDTYTQANGLGNDLVGAMTRDSDGDLWIATLNGLSRLRQGKITNFTTANGLSSNVITSLLLTTDGFLIAGTQDDGINILDPPSIQGAGAHSYVVPAGFKLLPQIGIRAAVDDLPLPHLWFATPTGIARCDRIAPGLIRAISCSNVLEFSTADGLRSRETAVNSHPSAWKSTDGRLWFATPKGLVEVDPARFPVNTVPPPVEVERFAVDDADQTLHAADMKISAGHNHFQIEYAAMSFVAPQKVRYRYKLEGFDHNWTDAGARRTAYYTNIPPGHYTFQVQAANNDGVWNTAGATLEFDLQPHFYQTIWFYLLLTLALLGLVLLGLRLRLMRAEREFGAVLGERNRIAREIHDTLAQGYVGISVQLEVMSELLRQKKLDAAAEHLDTTRGIVREGLKDARQSIWALRSQDTGETTLPVKLRRATEQAGGHGLKAHFNVHGAYRPLPPGTENEIMRVAQEALHNVKKHAGAKTVNVELEYLPEQIALEVRDDGCGFEVDGHGELPAGHYGLKGMLERAEAIGGVLEVLSALGAGVVVRMRAPAPRGAREEKEQV
ncbi:MAG: two-component regulator propeller domain-containing protein [Terracidiphilus sp.]